MPMPMPMPMPMKVKICGLSSEPTMRAALDAGADYVGLVFFPKSPRHVSLDQAQTLAGIVRGRAGVVALVVDPEDAQLDEIVARLRPDVIQLHGSEPPERVAQIKARHNVDVWKAIKVAAKEDAEQALRYGGAADLILFDAKPVATDRPGAGEVELLPGGNGMAFDWSALDSVRGRLDFMLSGGLDPGNVAEGIAATGAIAVDVSSGVEAAPGVKDEALIEKFVSAAKAAETASAT